MSIHRSNSKTTNKDVINQISKIDQTITELSGHRWTSSTRLNELDKKIKELMKNFHDDSTSNPIAVDHETKTKLTNLASRISEVLPKTTGWLGCIKYIFMRSAVKEAVKNLKYTAHLLNVHPELLPSPRIQTSNFNISTPSTNTAYVSPPPSNPLLESKEVQNSEFSNKNSSSSQNFTERKSIDSDDEYENEGARNSEFSKTDIPSSQNFTERKSIDSDDGYKNESARNSEFSKTDIPSSQNFTERKSIDSDDGYKNESARNSEFSKTDIPSSQNFTERKSIDSDDGYKNEGARDSEFSKTDIPSSQNFTIDPSRGSDNEGLRNDASLRSSIVSPPSLNEQNRTSLNESPNTVTANIGNNSSTNPETKETTKAEAAKETNKEALENLKNLIGNERAFSLLMGFVGNTTLLHIESRGNKFTLMMGKNNPSPKDEYKIFIDTFIEKQVGKGLFDPVGTAKATLVRTALNIAFVLFNYPKPKIPHQIVIQKIVNPQTKETTILFPYPRFSIFIGNTTEENGEKGALIHSITYSNDPNNTSATFTLAPPQDDETSWNESTLKSLTVKL